MTPYARGLLIGLTLLAALSCIRAPFPSQMYLQHIPTAVAILALAIATQRNVLSTAALTSVVAFLALHVLGARYIYSYVPYDAWAEQLTGITLSARFGWRRNHYDRLVHFAFGLLSVRPAWEILTRRFRVPRRYAWYASVEFVLAFSLLYELFEWALTMVLSPQDAGAYNGEQGDIWDAHRDMLCAFIGALVAVSWWPLVLRERRRDR